MRRLLALPAAAVLLVAPGRVAVGQDGAASSESFFKSPVFVVMPSVITLNAISRPAGTVPDKAMSGFNVRFQTVLPTSSPWITGVAGVQFMPNGPSGGNAKLNQPIVFYGAIVPVIQPKWTDGWLSVSADPLGVYFLNPQGGTAPYSHEFVMEGAAVLNIGTKMMKDMGAFQNLSAFFLVDQRITHPPVDRNGNKDYWNPVLVYGILLPIAPWK
jgi:hypothetical protein